jgi:hypothetical protein
MYIDEDEAQRRITTEENLLNRLGRGRDRNESEIEIPPIPSFDLDDILAISDPLTTMDEGEEKPSKSAEMSSNRLSRLLNMDPSYAGSGTKNLHRDTQAAVGVAAGILGTTKAARIGDVATSQAHSYARGYTGPVDLVNPEKSPKEELQAKIIEGHGIIVDKCFSRLLKSLDLLSDEKLEKVQKATDLTLVAKNLSSIIGHAAAATQDHVEVQEKSVHFHIMKPEMATDAEYKTIELSSEKEEMVWREKIDIS